MKLGHKKFHAQALLYIGIIFFSSTALNAKIAVITTTTDLNALVTEVGGESVSSQSFCKGTQDPHFIEAKPSFMVKASRADLIVAIGLELEVGWLPSIIRGARNPKITVGNPGYFEVGSLVSPLGVSTGKLSRAQGDVHPEGNPHVTLDPVRAGQIAKAIAQRLGELDPTNKVNYIQRAEALDARLNAKTKVWGERIKKSGVSKIITYHKTLTYFLDRFQLENPTILEPLPGIPPTAKHTLEVIATAKAQKVPLIMVENFFDDAAAQRVAKDVPNLRVVSVAVAVEGNAKVKSIDDVYEHLVLTIEGK